MNLISCPHCKSQPTVIEVARDIWIIECQAHPAFPVKTSGESMQEAIECWNDRSSWESLGAQLSDQK